MQTYYIARNADGKLCLFAGKPTKNIEVGKWVSTTPIPKEKISEFPVEALLQQGINTHWEDEEPVLVTLN